MKLKLCFALFLLICLLQDAELTTTSPDSNQTDAVKVDPVEKKEHVSIHVASWKWSYVKTPLILTIFVLTAGILKIGFHHADKLSSVVPESCLLIILGIIVGAISNKFSLSFVPHFTAYTFFLFLLPPIVLEAAYSLHDRAFFRNVGTILIYAVIGTIINFFLIGFSLYGFSKSAGSMFSLSIVEALVFSALISAVDPVAVLAIFQEIGVNQDLYFLVFGESLLNDAVTVVLYGMIETFTKMPSISPEQYGLGIVSFFTVSLGGFFIGVFIGVLTSLLTKVTYKVRVVEPLAFLGMAYFSYLCAELFHFSGIISIIGCGLIQSHYAKKNISTKSCITIKYFTKMISSICDSIIFLFLGMVLVQTEHVWDTGFVCFTIFLCLLCRFISVYFLTAIANYFRSHKINFEEQFIMAYGGLRGAVSFSLVILLDSETISQKQIYVTTTLAVVIFTVFVQGSSIKPLVKLLRIRTKDETKPTLVQEINHKVVGHLLAGVEEISGSLGDFYFKELFQMYHNKYIKPFLIRSSSDNGNLNRLYEKLTLADHYANLYGPSICLEDKKPLINSFESETDLCEVVTNMISEGGTAVNLKPAVSDIEVELRMPSAWGKVRNHFKKSLSMPNADSQSQTTTKRTQDHHKVLHRALSNSPYEKFHNTYNRNLIDDDNQELAFHLRRRCSNAKRLTSIILTPAYDHDSVSIHEHQGLDTSFDAPPDRRLDIYNVTQLLLDRASATKFRARNLSVTSSARTHRLAPKPVFSRAISLDNNQGNTQKVQIENLPDLKEDSEEGNASNNNKMETQM